MHVTVLYLGSCLLAQDFINESYPGITKVLLRAEKDQFELELYDKLIMYRTVPINLNL